MTLIPPNVAALIEPRERALAIIADARKHPKYCTDAEVVDALEAAYATPARSLPTVEEVAYECPEHPGCDFNHLCCCSDKHTPVLALLAREGEAK